MLRVNYQIVFGEVHGHNMDGKKWKVLFHPANVQTGAFIYHYKDDEGKKCAQLWNFLDGAEHIRNIMKSTTNDSHTLLGENVDKVKLNVYYKEARQIIEACAKSGYKVECYYKEPKPKVVKAQGKKFRMLSDL